MKQRGKKAMSWLLTLALGLSFLPALAVPAWAADDSSYTIVIPATLTVENAGWNELPGGISVTGTLINQAGRADQLTVTASSANDWKLKQQGGNETIGYSLKAAQGDAQPTTSWTFDSLSDTAETRTLGVDVADYSNNSVGFYSDTIIFTAEVKKIYTVTFDANGHGTAPAAQYIAGGDKVSDPGTPETKDPVDFGGWYRDSGFTQLWDFDADTVTGPMTLYAKWTAQQLRTLTIEAQYVTYDDDGDVVQNKTLSIQYYASETWADVVANGRGNGLAVEQAYALVLYGDDWSFWLNGLWRDDFPFGIDRPVAEFVAKFGSNVVIRYETYDYSVTVIS